MGYSIKCFKSYRVEEGNGDYKLVIGPTGSGRSYSRLAERLNLVTLGKECLEKGGEVYLADFTGEMKQYYELLTGCHFVSSENDFSFMRSKLKEEYDTRTKSGQILETAGLKMIHVIAYAMNEMPEYAIECLRELMNYTLPKQRLAKMVFILHNPGPSELLMPER